MTHLQAGTFRTVITPPLGVCMEGSFGVVRARDVYDDLYANALVLDDGDTEIALVSVDVCSIKTEDHAIICEHIAAQTGIAPSLVIVTATHTHSGPATGMDIDGLYDIDTAYVDVFRRQVASAVRLAQLRKRPAQLQAGRGELRDFLFNRRLVMPDGGIVMNWVDPARLQGARRSDLVDPELLVLRVDGDDGRPLAHVVNWANHNNAAPNDVLSADYAGVMARVLRQTHGEDLGVLFLPGAAGDVNWVDHEDPKRNRQGLYVEIGERLGAAVLAIEARLQAIGSPRLGVATQLLRIEERPYVDYDIAVDDTFGDPAGASAFFDAYRLAHDRYHDQPPPVHDVALHAVAFGSQLALCTNPAELFTTFGLQLKETSPFTHTMVAELSNGVVGYVPAPADFEAGGYEVRKVPGGSYLAVDAGERIVDTTRQLLQSVYQEGETS